MIFVNHYVSPWAPLSFYHSEYTQIPISNCDILSIKIVTIINNNNNYSKKKQLEK